MLGCSPSISGTCNIRGDAEGAKRQTRQCVYHSTCVSECLCVHDRDLSSQGTRLAHSFGYCLVTYTNSQASTAGKARNVSALCSGRPSGTGSAPHPHPLLRGYNGRPVLSCLRRPASAICSLGVYAEINGVHTVLTHLGRRWGTSCWDNQGIEAKT